MGDLVSAVAIAGNTSGSVTLQAPAVAGAGTLTLPTAGEWPVPARSHCPAAM